MSVVKFLFQNNHNFKTKRGHSLRKTIGRGPGGVGKTSGRGHKGQKARGHKKVASTSGFEGGQTPLYRRLPKRGFTNAAFARKVEILRLSQVAYIAQKHGVESIDKAFLVAQGYIKKGYELKLLSDNVENKPASSISVECDAISASAKASAEGFNIKPLIKEVKENA